MTIHFDRAQRTNRPTLEELDPELAGHDHRTTKVEQQEPFISGQTQNGLTTTITTTRR